jgi:hypothetical protein
METIFELDMVTWLELLQRRSRISGIQHPMISAMIPGQMLVCLPHLTHKRWYITNSTSKYPAW